MKNEVHAPVNQSKRFPAWLGTCSLHAVVGPTHNHKSTLKQEERTSVTLIRSILNVRHRYAPEQNNNRAGTISVIFSPTWPALQDREQKI